jgi:hypothetical protein
MPYGRYSVRWRRSRARTAGRYAHRRPFPPRGPVLKNSSWPARDRNTKARKQFVRPEAPPVYSGGCCSPHPGPIVRSLTLRERSSSLVTDHARRPDWPQVRRIAPVRPERGRPLRGVGAGHSRRGCPGGNIPPNTSGPAMRRRRVAAPTARATVALGPDTRGVPVPGQKKTGGPCRPSAHAVAIPRRMRTAGGKFRMALPPAAPVVVHVGHLRLSVPCQQPLRGS